MIFIPCSSFPRKRESRVLMGQRFKMIMLCGTVLAACAAVFSPGVMAADKPPKNPEASAPADMRIPFPRPDSHRGDWLRYHGRTVSLTGSSAEESGKACLACHGRNDCVKCHNANPPKDHTNFWRTRGHGLSASANSDRCLNCHRQDYCVTCHNETAPRSHLGRWNAITQVGTPDRPTHCTWCHYGSGSAPADNCIVCHKRAPHTSAPHPVSGALNCALCH